jgi:putative ABC transport system permease protein
MKRFLNTDQLAESLGIALDALRVSKLRSGLTILGVVIGVATVMTMATIVKGSATRSSRRSVSRGRRRSMW